MMDQVTNYFSRLFGAFGNGWTRFWFTPSDPATLSAIRLLTGLVVVYLHATLSLDLVEFFGPGGLLPLADVAQLDPPTFSYLNFAATSTELWTLHLIGLAILILFAAGFWTRLTSILALIVFLSDVNRAPMISGMTEPIVAFTMLYLCLAPCGRRFSVDRWLAERKTVAAPPAGMPPEAAADGQSTTATIATRLIQIHLAMLIAMMGFSQLGGEPWWNGTGMWWLMARQDSRLVDLTWLHTTPKVIELWAHALVLFELAFGVLIWIPLARPLLLAAGLVLWTLLALVTGDVTFAVMMCAASLAFVSPSVFQAWNAARAAVPAPAAQVVA